ncbi:2-phytyl-1,4-beta-naphthoquinone methyltransferase, chloroplastic [Hordeum vulgare]|nr:2-phytyl-1,4-beta-naphthoquinone methyltransferase, chloroplastic [Hordeum vulgare]
MCVSWSMAKRGDRVLDLCCGTGDLALLASEKVGLDGQVVAVDFSREQLQAAASRAERQWKPCYSNIRWMEGDALALPFADCSFNAVTMGYGLRNVVDKSKAMIKGIDSRYRQALTASHRAPLYGLAEEYKYLKGSISQYLTGSLYDQKMEFFTIILEKSSSRQVLPDNFVKMLDGHRPQNMKLRQAGNGLRKLWDVEVVFDTDGSMYLDRGWKQFVRAYVLRHGYFLVFRYDGNATFVVKVFDMTMCRRRYQDDDDAKMEFFTIILEKSSSRQVLPDNFVKMLDDHRPQNMRLRQAGNGLRKLWGVEVAFRHR